MKTYKITLLTPAGLVNVEYNTSQDLAQFEAELTAKYGTFITYKSEEIVTSG